MCSHHDTASIFFGGIYSTPGQRLLTITPVFRKGDQYIGTRNLINQLFKCLSYWEDENEGEESIGILQIP